ncbi:MAG: ATP-binding protein [Candidatus Omnitrophota bacterium]
MFSSLAVITVFCLYMSILFVIALLVERRIHFVKNLVNNPVIYSLGMAVYCTAWTYYGSVGKAATSGMLFITIYLGPTLTIIFWWTLLRKLVRIKSTYRITSIADFISARYNKSPAIAALATTIAFFGTLPYIALQFKAIFSTFKVITQTSADSSIGHGGNVTYIVVGLMILFTIIFGIRRLDPTERHQGMMVAVAIENTVQLFAFLVAGIFVCYFLYHGFGDILRQFSESRFYPLMSAASNGNSSFTIWTTYTILAMSAIICLPRQFHTTVVENTNEKHIRTAMWFFPLYMFLINIFVLPIAMSGLLKGYSVSQADNFVLLLPLYHGKPWVALVVFLGGFSAATSMIMITSMTMATMITNHLLLPMIGWFRWLGGLRRNLLKCRWIAAAGFIIVGYWFGQLVGESYMLVNIGLIAFAAVLQFAPVILGGIFWRRANKAGAIMGLSAGFIVWLYTLLIPSFVKSGWVSSFLLEKGPWGISFLNPEHLFGVVTLDPLSHSVFWSMLFNIGFYVLGAFYCKSSEEEQRHIDDFIGISKSVVPFAPAAEKENTVILNEKAERVENLFKQYFPVLESESMVKKCLCAQGIESREKISVVELAGLQNEAEKLLAGSIGTAAAHKALQAGPLFTDKESLELSTTYADILATLKVAPQELKRKVDFYQERTALLTQHAEELGGKVRELENQVAERKKAEEALQEERRLFVGGTTVVFKWKNEPGWPVEYVSQNVKGQFGYTVEEFIEKQILYASIIHSEDIDWVTEDIKMHSRSGAPYFEQEYRIARADGQYRWIYDFTAVIRAGDGQITHYHGYVSDITERREAQEKLEEAMEIKLKFISVVSHELRTPLTAIREGISLVLSGKAGGVTDVQKEFLEDVKSSVDRLTRLINDVLDFQKLEAKKMVFNLQPADINSVIAEATQQLAPLARERKLNLIVKLAQNLPQAKLDKDRITQVLTNLVDNALKYTERGDIIIGSAKDETRDGICVSVHNPGSEIKKEDIEKLFQKFEQLERGGKRKTGGTGLGLAICKEIIDQHGGKIWVVSKAGKGTTFNFTIPIKSDG